VLFVFLIGEQTASEEGSASGDTSSDLWNRELTDQCSDQMTKGVNPIHLDFLLCFVIPVPVFLFFRSLDLFGFIVLSHIISIRWVIRSRQEFTLLILHLLRCLLVLVLVLWLALRLAIACVVVTQTSPKGRREGRSPIALRKHEVRTDELHNKAPLTWER